MTKRIFQSICLVALAVFLASMSLIMGALYTYFSQTQHTQLRNQTALAAQAVAHEGLDYLQDLRQRDLQRQHGEPSGAGGDPGSPGLRPR